MMKKLKYVVSLILCVVLMASCLMPPALALEKRYDSNWVYWSQGASGIGGYMNSSGCRIVADAKLLKEAGIAPAAFDPDIYAQWANQNGYYGDKRSLSVYVGEQATGSPLSQGRGPAGYAKANGKTLYFCNQINFTSTDRTTRVNQVMGWLRDGYYVILGCGTHHAYVGRELSLSKGTPYILDSGSSYLKGPITAYETYSAANFTYARLYSTSSSKIITSVSAVTTGADTITETSAILRGSVSSSGTKLTECGVMLGTSSQDMTRLGYDSINTYGTTCYYSTSKYGRTLTPGTTYYYQVYAVVDGKECKGDIKSFTTAGTAPKPSLSVSLNQDSMTMQDNVSKALTATTTPSGLAVSWRSSDPTVATVTDGRVTALKAGATTITASVASGGQTAFAICQVTVTAAQATPTNTTSENTISKPSISISLSQASMTMQDNVSKTLTATTTPSGLTVSWRSSDPSVATVTNGNITALKAGTTTITASVSSDGQTVFALCQVMVTATQETCTNHTRGKFLRVGTDHPHDNYFSCSTCGQTYSEPGVNFTHSCKICAPINAYGIIFSGVGASSITADSVKLDASCTYTGSRPTSVGVHLGTSTSNLQIKGSDGNINHNKNPFNIWYNLNDLTAGTTYYYRFYAVVDGKLSFSEIKSFTTSVAR